MPLQLGFGEACGFLKMFRDYWWLQQYIYGFILVMLLYDLVTSGFDLFLVYFLQFGVHRYDNIVGLLLLRLTTCGFEMRNKVFDRFC